MTRAAVWWTALGVAGCAFLLWDLGTTLFFALTIAGLAQGGVLALSGIGLVLTYRATGVLNFAHGAIAMFVAFVLWQLSVQWGWPMLVAAPLAIGVVAPAIGVGLDALVFRPLERHNATTSEKLVATIGVFVVLVGAATAIWTTQTRTDPAALFPNRSVEIFSTGVSIGIDQLATLVLALVLTVVLYGVLRSTRLGRAMRAVVDRRELAELVGVNANRVGAVAWALGATLAGLTGVLLAPVTFGLDPFRLTLLVIETFSVAAIARLTSFPLAVLGGLVLGLMNSYQGSISFARLSTDLLGAGAGTAETVGNLLDPVLVNLPVFVLLAALLLYRQFPEVGGDERGAPKKDVGVLTVGTRTTVSLVVVGAGLLFPWLADAGGAFDDAHRMLALAVVFVSIVTVTGLSGHITLMQAAFAGMGSFFTGRLVTGSLLFLPSMPVVVAMVIAGVLCIPVGLAAGYPALRRRGLFLGLTTLAFGLVVERYVFNSFYFNPGPSTTAITEPSVFGIGLGGDRAFYYYELTVLGLVVLLAHRVRSGRLGRALTSVRDSEAGAESLGVRVRFYKLFAFSVSAFMAGIGGSLLGQRVGAFEGGAFITFNSLLWFAVVVVAGMTFISGAVVGAFLFTMLGTIVGDPGISILVVGLGAVAVGRLPGGLVGLGIRTLSATSSAARADGTDVRLYLDESTTARRASPAAIDTVRRARAKSDGWAPTGAARERL